ncbi:MAG: ferredoxin family protein [Verrucomicrobia bacterium]|nr:ferredoxin family protein [Verrucomicrobiota bacterium]
MKDERPLVLFCLCGGGNPIDRERREALLGVTRENGYRCEIVQDLCLLAAGRDTAMERWSREEDLTVLACYPRAVRSLFYFSGYPLKQGEKLRFLNWRACDDERIISQLEDHHRRHAGGGVEEHPVSPGDWAPWFPVIDPERCSSCGQCMSFCLFGVYEKTEDQRIHVAYPEQCKTNCPACARICPQVAIQFPKLNEAPINGAEIEDEDLEKNKVRLNIEKMLGSDPYAALRERSHRRAAKLLGGSGLERALAERRKFTGGLPALDKDQEHRGDDSQARE